MKRFGVLFLIIIFASVLRLYKLGEIPVSVNWDEAAIGYNAYSISQTLKDEHGVFLPLQYFTSFGDYKPPVYIYATAPLIKIFGLQDWVVRLPSAIAGILTVILTYFLTKEIFRYRVGPVPGFLPPVLAEVSELRSGGIPATRATHTVYDRTRLCETVALLSAFLLAISPWHINLSRAGFEANLALFLVVLGAVGFIRGMSRLRQGYGGQGLVITAVAWGLAFYTFNTPRVFLPLLMAALGLIYRRELWQMKKWVVLAGLVLLAFLAPLIPHLISSEGQLRFKEVNIFSNLDVIKTMNARQEADGNVWWSKIIHNRRLAYGLLFAKHYFDHYNPTFLFFFGDENPKFSTHDLGQMYIIEAPFLLMGFYWLVTKHKKAAWPLLVWLFLAPIPAGVARETPHALRAIVMLPILQIITAVGVWESWERWGRRVRWGKLGMVFAGVILFYEFSAYLHGYYVHYSQKYSQEWQYGYKEMVPYVENIKKDYDQVGVSDAYGRPYIFFLYYGKYAPEEFWQTRTTYREAMGFYHTDGFDKYWFGSSEKLKRDKKTLWVLGPNEVKPMGTKIMKTFYFKDGSPSFMVASR